MTLRRLTMTALLMLAASMLLVACGGGTSKADYEEQVSKIGDAVDKDLDSLDSGDPTPESIEAAQKSLDDAASDL